VFPIYRIVQEFDYLFWNSGFIVSATVGGDYQDTVPIVYKVGCFFRFQWNPNGGSTQLVYEALGVF
jgi:hypothetical protein